MYLLSSQTSAILKRWSKPEDDLQNSEYGLYSQVYPILLATIASVNRQKLSLFEAHFAVAVSASPVSVYLACMALYELYQDRRRFFDVTKHTGHVCALWLGAILPLVWLALNVIVSFSPTAFTNSDLCQGMTIEKWLEFQIVSNFVGVLDVMGRRDLWNDLSSRGGLGAISVGTLWVWGVYFVRHRQRIWVKFKKAQELHKHYWFFFRWPLHVLKFGKVSW